MFELLRQLKTALSERARPGEFEDGDDRLAAAALLVHVANADGVRTTAESARLLDVLSTRFGLDRDRSARLVDAAIRRDKEAIDYNEFVDVLKRSLDTDGRLRLIEMMFEIAYADGALHEFEGDLVARVAELLEVPEADVATSRRLAAAAGGGA